MIVDAVLNPAEIALLSARDLSGACCVVFDVLRATSSMLTGLDSGAIGIRPVCTIEEALAAKVEMPGALLGGERHGERIDGFDLGNSPFEYRDVVGREIISTTTNGTVALQACTGAARVLVAAILNLDAVAAEILRTSPSEVILVCAGTFAEFALEDAYAAGLLAEALGSGPQLTDSAHAVRAVARAFASPLEALAASRNGKALAVKGRGAEVEWCAERSRLDVLGEMKGGIVRKLLGDAGGGFAKTGTTPTP